MSLSIHTARLTLVPVAADDVDALCNLLWLAEVRQYLCDDALMPRVDVEATVADSLDPTDVTSYWRIAMGGNQCVGLIGMRPPIAAMLRLRAIGWRSVELLIALAPHCWGRGLASEAIEATAAQAGSDGVTFALVAGVDEPNQRSHRLMQRCGFHELGRIQGPVHPNIVYERPL